MNFGNKSILYNKKLYNRIFVWYILCLIATAIVFPSYALKPYLYLFGVISVGLFTLGAPNYLSRWNKCSEKQFVSRLFVLSFSIRLLYVIYIHFFNLNHYGSIYESNGADAGFYQMTALELANMKDKTMNFFRILRSWKVAADDSGYILYLTYLFKLTMSTDQASSVIVALIMKSVLGAISCVFSYRIALRHFGKDVGRMAGIFCCLHFSMIWWCGSMMKETEMVFCTMATLYYCDRILSNESQRWGDFLGAILAISSTFFFRTVLGVVLVLSALVALICIGVQDIGRKKKTVMIIIAALLLSFSAGNKLFEVSKGFLERATGTAQKTNMEWRSYRDGGNSFSKYAGAAVFAPLIFTIPFPTMVYTMEEQEMQMQVNGGNYLKNVLSFFVIISLLSLYLSKKWRSHLLIIAFMSGYVIILAFSEFAQSGRFHMPIMPVFMIFAAYGMTLLDKKIFKWFKMVLLLELIICIAWSWYKLAGRGWI